MIRLTLAGSQRPGCRISRPYQQKFAKALFGCAGPIPLSHTKRPFVNGEKAVFTPEMDAKKNGTSATKQGLSDPTPLRVRACHFLAE